jgi:DNA polymerase I-like protein with 3'-5' exonuclease and polymerase domains
MDAIISLHARAVGMAKVSGPFCKVSFSQVNLNSPEQMKSFLISQGWVPTTYTDKGSPQLTEDSYDSIKGELGQLIAKRAVLKHRAQMIFNITKQGQLKGFLNLMRADGRVEAGAETCGTNTGRMRHRGLVNIPKPTDTGLWPSDTQIRDLFTVPEGKLMMGIDADGLEARIMAHCVLPYRGGEEYAKEILEGDIHQANAEIFETDRNGAKSPFYCLMYGGQPRKLGETIGCSEAKAKRIFDRFWRESTALNGFKKAITQYWKDTGKKYIKGIDGRKIWVRSEHSIVNAYFQSTGSITVKVAALFLDKWCRKEGLTAQQLFSMHDELGYELPVKEKEKINELAAKAFVQSGKYLELRVPITGTPEFGDNWHEVH